MRPEILYPLFAPVTSLPGVGPRLAKLIEKAAGPQVVDLLWHLPTGMIDRRFSPKLAEACPGCIATVTVRIEDHEPGATARRPYRVRCSDGTGRLDLVFFHVRGDGLSRLLPVGATRVISGRLEAYQGALQMAHPDHIAAPEDMAGLKRVEPIYRLTAGLPAKTMARSVQAALKAAPMLEEWLDPAFLARREWPSWRDALLALHGPEEETDLLPLTPAHQRCAYDELLANQLALALVRARMRKLPGRAFATGGETRVRAVAALPFRLTGSQTTAVAEIDADMKAPARMLRLLQGDVGSGKTVVAFLAMLNAVESGAQAALMAPTEILARQHFATIDPLARAAGLETALLTGRDKGKPRQAILDGLATGRIPLLVGTHAVFQEDVAYHDLGLAVVDEQHRFGVHQRLALTSKGRACDMLVMTATPIPRTLMLTAYGDMDVSRLTEKPAGRRPIATRALPLERLGDVVAAVRRALEGKAKVYWVCPLVAESEVSDLAAASERHRTLTDALGPRVGLLHGQMKAAEKDAAMEAFAKGSADVLVATTVIEVGVDVAEATVMVIEHAERFGLAQLHQLRGRIGRGNLPSTCLLLYAPPLNETAKARLEILRGTDDGFRIAEEDLRLRGAGELMGTRQSGLAELHLADLAIHGELLAAARDDARLILDRDPELTSPRGAALRTLLYLFQRDAAVKLLRSG